jgi:hypothetical protein
MLKMSREVYYMEVPSHRVGSYFYLIKLNQRWFSLNVSLWNPIYPHHIQYKITVISKIFLHPVPAVFVFISFPNFCPHHQQWTNNFWDGNNHDKRSTPPPNQIIKWWLAERTYRLMRDFIMTQGSHTPHKMKSTEAEEGNVHMESAQVCILQTARCKRQKDTPRHFWYQGQFSLFPWQSSQP